MVSHLTKQILPIGIRTLPNKGARFVPEGRTLVPGTQLHVCGFWFLRGSYARSNIRVVKRQPVFLRLHLGRYVM